MFSKANKMVLTGLKSAKNIGEDHDKNLDKVLTKIAFGGTYPIR